MRKIKTVPLFAAVGATILVAMVFAQTAAGLAGPTPPPGVTTLPTSPVQNVTNISDIVCGILLWVFWLLIMFAIIMFLMGGYRYATSAGEPEKVQGANRTLLYAAIAVVVALCAWGVPTLIDSFLGGFNVGMLTSICG